MKQFLYDHRQFIEQLLLHWKELLLNAEFLQPLWIQTALLRAIRFTGDMILIFRDFPIVKVHSIKTEHEQIIFIGQEVDEFIHIFFNHLKSYQLDSHTIWAWHIPKKTSEWLNNGADMVVCAVSRLFPWRAQSRFTTSTPKWISQVYPIPKNCNDPLPENKAKTIRKTIERNPSLLNIKFTKELADFDLFYKRMYVPHVTFKHGSLVYVEPYEYLLKWFNRGGIIFTLKNDEPVAGVLVAFSGDVIHAYEVGILDGNIDLYKAGIIRIMDWLVAKWACNQGYKLFQLGGTYSFRSNGVFQYKVGWYSTVRDFFGFIRNEWRINLEKPSLELVTYLNKLGIIHENNRKYFSVFLQIEEANDNNSIEKELNLAIKDGLAGIRYISPNKQEYFSQTRI